MEKKVALRLLLCVCLISILKCALGDMCGTKSYTPPRYRCCGKPGREQFVFDTTNEMCLRRLYSDIYHVLSAFFPCGNLPKKYDYRNQLCIKGIKNGQFQIIPRFAYCHLDRYDRRLHYCHYDFWTGRWNLYPAVRR